jgi:pteridine reductase
VSARPLAVVTGGARRVGRAISQRLADAGFDLVIAYRESEAEARTTAADLARAGASVRTERVDLNDPTTVEAAGTLLARKLARVDVLIHNASIYGPTPLATLSADEALRHYRVNALAPLLLTKHLAPRLAESDRPGGGAIVAMSDLHATGRPRKGFAAYSMSKAALTEMVRTLARELAPRVRVNGVAPGVVAWPETGSESDQAMQQAYLSRVPLGRAGTPADAAEVVRWLAMDATYLTGQIIRLDGGRSIT